jgi:hypothetical protein
LAKSLPENILGRYKKNQLQTEAMIFGTAGMLNDNFEEEYPLQLQQEYIFLKNKFRFTEVENHIWKFLRLRPANFPTIRLAQFSSLVVKSHHLFSQILEASDLNNLIDLLNVEVSPYWKNHFTFGNLSPETSKPLGIGSIHNILINTIVPFLFLYGNQKGLGIYRERALNFLDVIPSEKNNLLDNWQKLGVASKSAMHSQGLIELKNKYCDEKKCLQCSIGNKILRNV